MKSKSEIRAHISDLKSQLTTEEINQKSQIISERLFKKEYYKKADIVFIYMSANQEIRTDFIIKQAQADGKQVAVPVTFPGRRMEFVYLDDKTEFAEKWGIKEPARGVVACPDLCSSEMCGYSYQPISDSSNILIILPGLAFDHDGNRLGYGGGYYDRYLARLETTGLSVTKAALCFNFQMLDSLPTDEFDKKVDHLIII